MPAPCPIRSWFRGCSPERHQYDGKGTGSITLGPAGFGSAGGKEAGGIAGAGGGFAAFGPAGAWLGPLLR